MPLFYFQTSACCRSHGCSLRELLYGREAPQRARGRDQEAAADERGPPLPAEPGPGFFPSAHPAIYPAVSAPVPSAAARVGNLAGALYRMGYMYARHDGLHVHQPAAEQGASHLGNPLGSHLPKSCSHRRQFLLQPERSHAQHVACLHGLEAA